MTFLIGIDGGGTRTTLCIAGEDGREMLRREGPAGLVDPRAPTDAAEALIAQTRAAMADAGVSGAAAALYAGLAGVGGEPERLSVERALSSSGIAERVAVRPDGEAALQGAFGGRPGILLIAGTGSIGLARSPQGSVERCGGWGMIVGDEGSGYGAARAGLTAVLRAFDGRGEETRLLPEMLAAAGLSAPPEIPAWTGRARKAEVAALSRVVTRLAEEGDAIASEIVAGQARALVEHASALLRRLAWLPPVPVVLHGGLARAPVFAAAVADALRALGGLVELRDAEADAVSGAVQLAARLGDPGRSGPVRPLA